MNTPVVLHHYTCEHGRKAIDTSGVLLPHLQPQLPGSPPLLWLTDLDTPDRDALGLTSRTLACDRTAHHYLTVTATAVHWPVYARAIPRTARDLLELVPGAMPMHWWVTDRWATAIPAAHPPATTTKTESGDINGP